MPGHSWVSKLSLAYLEPVPIPEVLSSPHRLTLQLQKSFSLRIPDSYGRVRSSGDDIDVKVAPASIPKSASLRGCLRQAAEERGYAFAPRGSDYEPGMSIVIKRRRYSFLFSKNQIESCPHARRAGLVLRLLHSALNSVRRGASVSGFEKPYPHVTSRHSSIGPNIRSKLSSALSCMACAQPLPSYEESREEGNGTKNRRGACSATSTRRGFGSKVARPLGRLDESRSAS